MVRDGMESVLDVVDDSMIQTGVRYSDLQYQIRSLIQRSQDDPDVLQRDWAGVVSDSIVESLIDATLRHRRWIAGEHKDGLNILFYRMSYEIWLSAVFARHHASGELSYSKSFLREIKSLENLEHPTVGDIAHFLCQVLIIVHQARDSYDYDSIDKALEECTRLLPHCTLKDFKVLQCFQIVAIAGKSRESHAAAPSDATELENLAKGISEDTDRGGGAYCDHALMVLVSAVGHRKRSDLVSDIHGAHRGDVSSISPAKVDWISWMVERLGSIEQQWEDSKDVGFDSPVWVMKHDLHYYQYYAHHVKAIATATQAEARINLAREAPSRDVGDAEELLTEVSKHYDRASDQIEKALSNVPPSNYSRWLYYNVTAEALEHETNLRMEMLGHEQRMAKTVYQLLETVSDEATNRLEKRVESLTEDVRQDLRNRMADISTRIVEIIGVFLAIVAIVATTIVTSTAGDLSLTQRLIILVVGGLLPIAYFALLRSIIHSPVGPKIGFFARLRNRGAGAFRENSKMDENPERSEVP